MIAALRPVVSASNDLSLTAQLFGAVLCIIAQCTKRTCTVDVALRLFGIVEWIVESIARKVSHVDCVLNVVTVQTKISRITHLNVSVAFRHSTQHHQLIVKIQSINQLASIIVQGPFFIARPERIRFIFAPIVKPAWNTRKFNVNTQRQQQTRIVRHCMNDELTQLLN